MTKQWFVAKEWSLLIRKRQTYDSSQMNNACTFPKDKPMAHREWTILTHLRKMNLWSIAKEKFGANNEPVVHHERTKITLLRKTKNISLWKSKICSIVKVELKRFKKTLPIKILQILWIHVELSWICGTLHKNTVLILVHVNM